MCVNFKFRTEPMTYIFGFWVFFRFLFTTNYWCKGCVNCGLGWEKGRTCSHVLFFVNVDWCSQNQMNLFFCISNANTNKVLKFRKLFFFTSPKEKQYKLRNQFFAKDREMREKLNPFHARFTLKTVRFAHAKLINIWIEINSCWSCIKNLKIPSADLPVKRISYFTHFSILGIVFIIWIVKIKNNAKDCLLSLYNSVPWIDSILWQLCFKFDLSFYSSDFVRFCLWFFLKEDILSRCYCFFQLCIWNDILAKNENIFFSFFLSNDMIYLKYFIIYHVYRDQFLNQLKQ